MVFPVPKGTPLEMIAVQPPTPAKFWTLAQVIKNSASCDGVFFDAIIWPLGSRGRTPITFIQAYKATDTQVNTSVSLFQIPR